MTRTYQIPTAILDAEASILGGCLIAPYVLRDLELDVDDLFHFKHKVVFTALRNLEARSAPIDVLTVEAEVERAGKLDAIGGVSFLGELALRVPTVDNVHEYASLVRGEQTKRRVMVAASDIVMLAADPTVTGAQMLERASAAIGSIDGPTAERVETIGELAARRFADVERFAQEMAAGGRALSGVPTGVANLDAKLGGWQRGIVNLIAARPGMGKSSLALATADAASEAGYGAHVFTLEDSWHAYTDRQLARLAGVPAIKIRQADIDRDEVARLYRAVVDLRDRKNWIVDERGGLTAQEVVRAMRRQQDRVGTRVAICDYIQLLKRRDPRMSDHEHLGDAMQTLVESAKVDDVAWVVLSQFNRELEKRVDKRPQLSDLRGSGEIEEKCKIAVALYRGSYYGGRPKRDVDYECNCPEAVRSCAHAPSMQQWEEQCQLLVLKGGNGPTGLVMAHWSGATTRIS